MDFAPVSPATAVACVMLVALIAYAWFAGADFGAGFWDLTAGGPRASARRELIAHALGPVWEANHVWLIIVVVLLFTGFPAAFVAIMTALHVPLTLMLVGIVLRGSAFTFRSYDNTEAAQRRWNRVFSIPSVVTPVLLGMVVGAIASGRLPTRPVTPADLFMPWLTPFAVTVGLFTLALFAYLAAVYLTLETGDRTLSDDFRRRAIGAALVVGVLALAVYGLARSGAPLVFQGLDTAGWGRPVRQATAVCSLAALLGLAMRWYQLARVAAMLQVALILWGCALALHPYLVPPDLTVAGTAAPDPVLRALLVTLGVGSLVLCPSLLYLFRIFKGHTLVRPSGTRTPPGSG